jgi:titin
VVAIQLKNIGVKRKASIGIAAAVFVAGFGIFQFISSNVAQAAARTWVGGGATAVFSDPANWSGGVIPADGDTIIMDEATIPSETDRNLVVTNDISGLELTGISFVNSNPDSDGFYITGNAMSIEGAIETDDIHMEPGSGVFLALNHIVADLTLTGPLTIEGVVIGDTTVAHSLNIGAFPLELINKGDEVLCASTGIVNDVTGSGAITISSSGENNAVQIAGQNDGFTGSITVASGAGLMFGADSARNASVIRSEGVLALAYDTIGQTGPIAIETPLQLAGTVRATGVDGFSLGGCAGELSDASYVLDGGVELIGNLTYEGYTGDVLPIDTHINAPYRPHQYSITTSAEYDGVITADAPIVDTAPDAPTGLFAAPSGSQIALSWTAPANNGGRAITDYVVQYKLAADATWTTFNDGTSTSTNATITGLPTGQIYDVRVSAVNGIGTGAAVSEAGVVVVGIAGAPTGLSGTPAAGQVALSWTAPANNGGSAITDYTVEYKLNADTTWTEFAHTASTATGRTVTGLMDGARYDFRVATVNAQGQSGFAAITNVAVPAVVAGTPTSLNGTPSDSQVTLSWIAPANNGGSAITDYVVQYKLAADAGWTTFNDGTSASTGATVTGLANGNTYDFRVAAVNGAGTSSYATVSDVVLAAVAPDAPTGMSAKPGNGQVALSWTAPTDDGGSAITDYTIQYKVSADSAWSTFAHSASATTSRIVTGLSNGSTYDFRVAAVNAQGTSLYVTTTNILVPAVVADAPARLNAVPAVGEVALSWTAPANNGGSPVTDYAVQYKLSADVSWTTVNDGVSMAVNVTVTGLENGLSYDFRVAAVNGAGTSSYATETNVVTPVVAPSAPLNLSAVPAVGQVLLDWDAPVSTGGATITDYIIEYKLAANATWSAFAHTASGATARTVTGLTNGAIYDFRVSAVNTAGTGPQASVTDITVETSVASAPQSLNTTPSSEQVILDWSAPVTDGGATITDYVIQYKLSSSSVWTTFVHGSSAATTATITGLTNDELYDFRVAAVNAKGQGAFATVSDIEVSAGTTVADAPTNVEAAVDSAEQIVLEWDAPANNGGFPITEYVVGYKLAADATWSYVTVPVADGTSYTFTDEITQTGVYDFSVTAVNAEGQGATAALVGFEYTVAEENEGGLTDPNAPGAPNTGVGQFVAGDVALVLVNLLVASGLVGWFATLAIRRYKKNSQK